MLRVMPFLVSTQNDVFHVIDDGNLKRPSESLAAAFDRFATRLHERNQGGFIGRGQVADVEAGPCFFDGARGGQDVVIAVRFGYHNRLEGGDDEREA
jgi:hypothetical protein